MKKRNDTERPGNTGKSTVARAAGDAMAEATALRAAGERIGARSREIIAELMRTAGVTEVRLIEPCGEEGCYDCEDLQDYGVDTVTYKGDQDWTDACIHTVRLDGDRVEATARDIDSYRDHGSDEILWDGHTWASVALRVAEVLRGKCTADGKDGGQD